MILPQFILTWMWHMIGSSEGCSWVKVASMFVLKTSKNLFEYILSAEVHNCLRCLVLQLRRNGVSDLRIRDWNEKLMRPPSLESHQLIPFIGERNESVPNYGQNEVLLLVVRVYKAFPASTIIFPRSTFYTSIKSHTNNDLVIVWIYHKDSMQVGR